MKQFLIFVFGLMSMVVFVCGMVCGVQAIASGEPFSVVCGVVFMIIWVYVAINWLKSNGPDMLYKQFFEKD